MVLLSAHEGTTLLFGNPNPRLPAAALIKPQLNVNRNRYIIKHALKATEYLLLDYPTPHIKSTSSKTHDNIFNFSSGSVLHLRWQFLQVQMKKSRSSCWTHPVSPRECAPPVQAGQDGALGGLLRRPQGKAAQLAALRHQHHQQRHGDVGRHHQNLCQYLGRGS